MTYAERTELRKTAVGFVFQKVQSAAYLSAEDNIRIVQYIAGRSTAFDPAFQAVLACWASRRDESQASCALGKPAQRVAITRGVANSHAILLADEPTGNLDSENSAAVLRLMKDLNRRPGQTILMITHDPDAAGYADRVVKMRDGCIV